jgi:hypothetical protein
MVQYVNISRKKGGEIVVIEIIGIGFCITGILVELWELNKEINLILNLTEEEGEE